MAKYRTKDVKPAVRLTAEARRQMARLISIYGDRPGMIVEWALSAYEPKLTGVPTSHEEVDTDNIPLSTDLETAVEVLQHGVELLREVAAHQKTEGSRGALPVPRLTLPGGMGGVRGGGPPNEDG